MNLIVFGPLISALAVMVITKRVVWALLLGSLIAALLKYPEISLRPFEIFFQTLFDEIKNPKVPSLIALLLMTGGWLALFEHRFQNSASERLSALPFRLHSKRSAIGSLIAIRFLTCFEIILSTQVLGSLYQSVFSRLRISKAKLAYVLDTLMGPLSILIPLNSTGLFIYFLIQETQVRPTPSLLFSAWSLNFYVLFSFALLFISSFTSFDFGPMKNQEIMAETISDQTQNQNHRVIPWASIMVYTLTLAITCLIAIIYYQSAESLLVAMVIGTGLSIIYEILTIKTPVKTSSSLRIFGSGLKRFLPLCLILVLCFHFSGMQREIGLDQSLSSLFKSSSGSWAPLVAFLVTSAFSFATGTSWLTWALFIPAFLSADIPAPLLPAVIGATLGGGTFGDHCSPFSDTSLLASTASRIPLYDHIRTQLPYALVCAILTLFVYTTLALYLTA